MLFSLLVGCSKYNFSDLEYFSFRYNTGNMMYADVCYTLKLEDNVYTATVKPEGVASENADQFVVDEAFVQKLIDLLTTNNVQKWNGFSKADKHVQDGYHFDLYVKNKANDSISASGYMKWPQNYAEVKKGLNDIFMNLYNIAELK